MASRVVENALTRVIEDPREIEERTKYVTGSSNSISVCSTFDSLSQISRRDSSFQSFKQVLEKYRNGEHGGIRWIGPISQEDIEIVSKWLDLGMQIRHIPKIPMDFSLTDKEFNLRVEGPLKSATQKVRVLISSDPSFIKSFGFLFEELWHNGVDAQQRLKELEEQREHVSEVDYSEKCVLQTSKDIKSVRDLDAVLKTHDWEITRKYDYHRSGFLVTMRCKRCEAERLLTMASTLLTRDS